MPYLTEEVKTWLAYNDNHNPEDPGHLNYLMTLLIIRYLEHKGLKYIGVNDVVGALECAKLEFYRRVGAPYEDIKAKQNGDVYEPLIKAVNKAKLKPTTGSTKPIEYTIPDSPFIHAEPYTSWSDRLSNSSKDFFASLEEEVKKLVSNKKKKTKKRKGR